MEDEGFVCIPTAYNIANHSGMRCFCVMSRFDNQETLICIPLSIIGVTYFGIQGDDEEEIGEIRKDIIDLFSNDPQKVKTWENQSIVRVRGYQDIIENLQIPSVSKLTMPGGDIVQILASFSHTPYTPFIIKGEHTLTKNNNRSVALFKTVLSWENVDKSQISSEIMSERILYFDTETEVSGSEFPIPSREGLTCISFAFNDEPTKVFTTFPTLQLYNKYPQGDPIYNNFPEITIYNDQESMLYAFMKLALTADRIVSYNGNSFDWPFIIGLINRISPGMWAALSAEDGRNITISRQSIFTPVGYIIKDYLCVPGIEHVDLLYVVRKLFPFWANHKLDTTAKELVGEGKSGFSMKKYFALVREHKQAREEGINLSEKALELLKDALTYSEVDTKILRKVYQKLNPYRSLSIELCGLTCETWSKTKEIEGFLTRVSPAILFSAKPSELKLQLTPGFYPDVRIYMFNDIAIKCIRSQDILQYIKQYKTSDGYSLQNFDAIFNQLFEYSSVFDLELYWNTINQIIERSTNATKVGNMGLYSYIKGTLPVDGLVYSYDALVVPTKASWVSLNINSDDNEKYDFTKKGLSTICRSLPKRLDDIISHQISLIRVQLLKNEVPHLSVSPSNNEQVEDLLFPEGRKFFIEEFVSNVKVRPENSNNYQELLTFDEIEYLQSGGEFIDVYYIDTNSGIVRVYYPYQEDLELRPDYYIKTLKTHLETLEKSISGPRPRGKPKVIKEDEEETAKPVQRGKPKTIKPIEEEEEETEEAKSVYQSKVKYNDLWEDGIDIGLINYSYQPGMARLLQRATLERWIEAYKNSNEEEKQILREKINTKFENFEQKQRGRPARTTKNLEKKKIEEEVDEMEQLEEGEIVPPATSPIPRSERYSRRSEIISSISKTLPSTLRQPTLPTKGIKTTSMLTKREKEKIVSRKEEEEDEDRDDKD